MNIFDLVYQDPNYYPVPTSFLCQRLQVDLSGLSVLDLGCGNGRNALELLRRGAHVMATDPAASGVDALSKQATVEDVDARLTTSTSDMPRLDPQHFDGVVLSTVLDHVERPEALRILNRVSRAMKPDAWVYASVFTTDDPGYRGNSRSETNSGVVTYWDPLDFATQLRRRLRSNLVTLSVDWSEDNSHGPRHFHHLLRLIAVRGEPAGLRTVSP